VNRPDLVAKHGIDMSRPYVLFVGRITRQKGIIHLVNAIEYMNRDYQIVLCAGMPDTPEIAAEMQAAVAKAKSQRDGVIWIQAMLPVEEKIALYSHAEVFCCPSIYEPFGIINLEAMACETAVVASAVGGIKEVVLPGETGLLVPLAQQSESPYEAEHPQQYARDLAHGVNHLMANKDLRDCMAKAGRHRAEEHFSWRAIAEKTYELYKQLVD
jgi:glycosyltransferase involved in cell wall biosynthesis